MEELVDDMIVTIATFLNNMNKIRFLSISKRLHPLKIKVYYHDEEYIDHIYKLPYYDMFTNVIFDDVHKKLPKSVTHLTSTKNFDKCIKGYIPNTVTHVCFESGFNQDINE